VAVSSNEDAVSDSPQWIVLDQYHLELRASRLGTGSGRQYTITGTCHGDLGTVASGSTTVTVPHDQSGTNASQ